MFALYYQQMLTGVLSTDAKTVKWSSITFTTCSNIPCGYGAYHWWCVRVCLCVPVYFYISISNILCQLNISERCVPPKCICIWWVIFHFVLFLLGHCGHTGLFDKFWLLVAIATRSGKHKKNRLHSHTTQSYTHTNTHTHAFTYLNIIAIVFSWWSSKSTLIHWQDIFFFAYKMPVKFDLRSMGNIAFSFCFHLPTHTQTHAYVHTEWFVYAHTHTWYIRIRIHSHMLTTILWALSIHSHIKCYCRIQLQ